MAAGTTLGGVYFGPKAEWSDPLLQPVMDFAAWCTILILSWRLTHHAYVIEADERRLRLQREIDERSLAMRAAALTCTSHEVRTPLAGILSFTEMLLDESPGKLTDVQRDFITEIERCGQYLLTLVNDILDYAKVQAGQTKLATEIVALNELVEQCIAMVQPKAVKQQIKLAMQIDPAAGEIVADPIRLKQIILNLVSNAVKYSPAGGLVRIQARLKDGQVLIGVRDTGRGMTPEQINHLFDPYFQATTGDQRIGTGLGLGIAKLLAELHGGGITVESAPGAGSLFTVRLPVRPTATNDPASGGARTWSWMSATGASPETTTDLCESAA